MDPGSSGKRCPIEPTFIKHGMVTMGKDRFTVVLCGNIAGHMIKPSIEHGEKNPWALKN